MGRDKKNEKRVEHYTQLTRKLMSSPAWKALTPSAQALYPWLRLEWRGSRYNNNGKLRLSVRQAADCMGCDIKTAARAFHNLQAKGFIVITEPARLGISGAAKAPAFELTEIPLPQLDRVSGRQLYMSWQKGRDFSFEKATANNPMGFNGKTKTRA